jgi:cytochrome c553
MPANLVNIAEAYDLNDQHGRQDAGSKVGKGTLKPPWNNAGVVASAPYAALNCTTCHSAHGTENIHNLRSSIVVAGVQMEIGGETGSGFSTFSGTTYTLPVEAGSQTDHKWGAWCTFCHELTGHSNYTEATSCNGPHMHGGSGF